MKSSDALPIYRVRRSKIHGTGVFAARDIKKGNRICEYVGDRISHAEADRRYADKADDDNHTFLFTVDNRIVIDGGVGGNDAKFINHSCGPNCETVIDGRRVFVEAIRDISKGAELGYDYLIERDESDPADIDLIWACRCGAAKCRGSMLLPRKPKRKKAKKAKKTKKVAKKKAPATRSSQKSKSVARKAAENTKTAVRGTRSSVGKVKAKAKTKQRAKAKAKAKGRSRLSKR